MPPPPAEPFAARILLGPALRAQPDRRLVKLVREGYEAAFEEIVRRYRRPLDRFAAAIVGGRSEDVTQDAFRKALVALRDGDAEIELKPWLYRIVRNTALNDLRDGPPATEELSEALAGGRSAAEEFESREEIGELMGRLRALPEPQRAAIVMRELEGLSHEEIAAALGVSGGAARQAIYRARLALRDGLGLLVPLPLLRMLFDHGAEAAASAGGAVAATGAAAAASGGGAALGGIGAAGALKVGLATVLVAGSVVAMQHDRSGDGGGASGPAEASAAQLPVGESGTSAAYGAPDGPHRPAALIGAGEGRGHSGPGSGAGENRGDRRGRDSGSSGNSALDDSSQGSGGSNPDESSGNGGHGSRHGGGSGSGDEGGESHSGEGSSGGSHSGRHSSGDSGDGSGSGGDGGSSGGSGGGESSHGGSGSDSAVSGSDGSGSSGSDDRDGQEPSDDPAPAIDPPATTEPPPVVDDSGSGKSGSGSGGSGSGGGEVDS